MKPGALRKALRTMTRQRQAGLAANEQYRRELGRMTLYVKGDGRAVR
jgi:hypothetical protein